ncbi:MAG TPA: AI-2E family transporter [Segetibacter sp.]|jgi:predicted PurR-regulated permease PerM
MKIISVPFYVRLAFILIILVVGGYICVLGENIIVPLLFSLMFAILLLPIANFFENKLKLPRSLASIVAVLLLLLALSCIVYILGAQLTTLMGEWPALKLQLLNLSHNLQNWMARTFHFNIARQTTYINNATNNLLKSSGTILEKTVLSLSSILLFLVFILIYTLFLLFYRRLLMRFVVAAFTEKYIDVIYDILENIKHIIRKYITGLFFEMVIVAIISGIVFWVLGIEYVFLLALIVGIFNLIPYIGIFTALLLSTSIAFATTDGKHAIFVAIAIVCIHLFDSNFLMPKIVGAQVKLNPLIVILGVIVGEMLFGISGMFLSIPYLAIAKVIFDRVEGLQPWGILLGEEEDTPKKVKNMVKQVKEKQGQSTEEPAPGTLDN